MALPTIGDYLTGQQTINPFAAQALAQATQGANLQATAQQEAALSQLAMQPNVAQEATRPEVASTGQRATMANIRQPRLSNLGFSALNAVASQTPQAVYRGGEPVDVLAQGLTNVFNIREQRQARQDLMGLMQQQQAAAQQAAQQKAAAAAVQQQQQLQGLASLGYSPDIAAGIVASGQGGQVLGQLQGLAKNYADIQGILQRQQTAQRIDPSITNVQQTMPQSPINAAVVRELLPKFNQFDPTKQLAETTKLAAEAALAAPSAELDVRKKQEDLTGSQIDNYLKPIKAQSELATAEADRLKTAGDIRGAEQKIQAAKNREAYAQEYFNNYQSMTPAERRAAIGAYASLYGGDPEHLQLLEAPKTEVKKIGKNDYGVVLPDGTVQRIDPKKLDMAGTPSPVAGVIPQQPAAQQSINIAPTQPQPVAQVLKSRQLRTQLQQAKPGSQKQKDLIKQIREAEAAEGSQRRSERFTPIQGGSFNLQVPEQVLMVPSLAPTEMSF